jgi:sensor histidine kinase regulating citrate/malate metabolism
MDTIDLYVLFGNLIDNCIEAVSRLPETEVKNVQVTVRREKGFVIITTENGYTGELQWSNGRIRTSKDDQQNHGFGILSIEKIIHKYGGRYSIQTENNIFVMDIVFPVSAEKQ